MNAQLTWYAARAAGIVAWSLAAGSVVWGLALSTHALGRKPRPAWLFDLHRFLGGMALMFTGVHVLAILFDTYVTSGWSKRWSRSPGPGIPWRWPGGSPPSTCFWRWS